MNRYPRSVQDARFKCISCNAPVTITVDDRYVCIECGQEILKENRKRKATDGGTATAGSSTEALSIDTESATKIAESSSSPFLPADSDETPDLSFVLPTKNEEQGIETCLHQIRTSIEELDVTAEVIVSDNSEDRTPERAMKHGAIVVEPYELGYGAAYRYGFEHARGNLIVMGDADTTYDFTELSKLIEPIHRGRADIVIGSRFDGEIKDGAMPPLHRYVGNPLLTTFLNLFYGTDISDAHSGFRVFTQDALRQLDLSSDGMEFASEMVMDAATKGLEIKEVPITYHERKGEATLHSVRDGWRHVKFMLTNCPTYLFAIPGIAMAALGLVFMGLSFFSIQPGTVVFGVHTMILGSLLTILGCQVGSLALFSAIAGDPIRKPEDPITRWIDTNFRLEHGATLGVLLFGFGALYGLRLFVGWIAGGFTGIPFVPSNLLATTAMIVGLMIIFNSFYLSTLADQGS